MRGEGALAYLAEGSGRLLLGLMALGMPVAFALVGLLAVATVVTSVTITSAVNSAAPWLLGR